VLAAGVQQRFSQHTSKPIRLQAASQGSIVLLPVSVLPPPALQCPAAPTPMGGWMAMHPAVVSATVTALCAATAASPARIPHSYSRLQRPRCRPHSTRSCPCSCDSIAPPSAVAQGRTRGASHNQHHYCCVAQTAWAAAERTAASHNSITSTNS
jgi:hypothetical protein